MNYKIISRIIVTMLLFAASFTDVSAQVVQKIGYDSFNINPSAVLEVQSSTKGFLPPRMTNAQKLSINVTTTATFNATGLIVYVTDAVGTLTAGLQIWDGTNWTPFLRTQLAAGQILLGDANGNPVATDLSGDVLISNTGATTIQTGVVTSDKILDGTIATADIADSAVTTNIIADANVTTAKIADGAVTSAKIGDETITSADILNGTIATVDIADDAVDKTKIAADVAGLGLQQNTDGSLEVNAGTGLAINADGSLEVNVANIVGDGNITSTDLTVGGDTNALLGDVTLNITDSAVTSAKIANETILSEDIFDGTIATADIADSAVTTNIIADDALTAAKINSDVAGTGLKQNESTGALEVDPTTITGDGNITSTDLTVGGDTNALLGDVTLNITDSAVTSAKIANETILSEDILDGTIATADIADSAVTTDIIAASAVTSAKIADGTIATADIAASAVTTDIIADANVTTAKIATDAVDKTKIAADVAGTGLKQNTDGSLEIDIANIVGDGDITSTDLTVGGDTNALLGNVTLDITDGAVTSAKILDGAIMNIDVANNAAIAGTKINPDFGAQAVSTTGTLAAGNTTVTGTLGVTGAATLNSAVITNNATVGGTLGVTGDATLANATVTGQLNVTGTAAAFTAIPTAPTATAGDSSTQLATTEFVTKSNRTSSVKIHTTSFAVTLADNTLLCDASAAGFAFTLPNAGDAEGKIFIIRKTDNSNNAITFPSLILYEDIVEGNILVTSLNYAKTVKIQSNGTSWYVIQ